MINNQDNFIVITAPHFCCGVCFDKDNIVINAAPIVKYMMGWTKEKVETYCKSKNWEIGETIPFKE